VKLLREAVIVGPQGLPYDGESWKNYGKHILAALKNWNAKIEWKAKDLRNCLPTFAVVNGQLNDVWEQYIGHAPRSITARHYIPRLASISKGEEDALIRQTNLFRLHVTEPLNQAILGKFDVRILNNFEHEGYNLRTCSK
jgi:hypothetical protein